MSLLCYKRYSNCCLLKQDPSAFTSVAFIAKYILPGKGKELLFKVCTHLLQKENLYFFKDDGKYDLKFLTVYWNLHNFTRCFWEKNFFEKIHSKINIHSNVWVCTDQTYVIAF